AKGSPTGVKLARKHLLISKNCRHLKLRASAHADPGVVQTIPREVLQPAANIRFEFSDHYEMILCISGEKCWNLMRSDLQLIMAKDEL
ncbi:hypothetical protein, partial [Hydrogenophaga sp. A37]|uniref:hypothetical protein n=1 Tax=Hydrogenophaga sp. A37 TaxID=1945864 RepID=UPI001C0BBBA0